MLSQKNKQKLKDLRETFAYFMTLTPKQKRLVIKFYFDNLYDKYITRRKERFKRIRYALETTVKFLSGNNISGIRSWVRHLEEQIEYERKKYIELKDQFNYLQQKALLRTSDSVEIALQRIEGTGPLLFIKVKDRSYEMTYDNFMRMRNHINNACPGINLMLLVNGDIEISELADTELAKRIIKCNEGGNLYT